VVFSFLVYPTFLPFIPAPFHSFQLSSSGTQSHLQADTLPPWLPIVSLLFSSDTVISWVSCHSLHLCQCYYFYSHCFFITLCTLFNKCLCYMLSRLAHFCITHYESCWLQVAASFTLSRGYVNQSTRSEPLDPHIHKDAFPYFTNTALVCLVTISIAVYQCTRQWEYLTLLGRLLQSSAQFYLDAAKLILAKHHFSVINGFSPCHLILSAAMLRLHHNLYCLLNWGAGKSLLPAMWMGTKMYIIFLLFSDAIGN
jgi:hypothetical protein